MDIKKYLLKLCTAKSDPKINDAKLTIEGCHPLWKALNKPF